METVDETETLGNHPPIEEHNLKHTAGDDDSGLDNSSESGRSCDDDKSTLQSYGSSEFLETDPPGLQHTLSLRRKVESFLKNEREEIFVVSEDLPSIFIESESKTEVDEEVVAVPIVEKLEELVSPEEHLPKAETHQVDQKVAVLNLDEPSTISEETNDFDLNFLPQFFREIWVGRMVSCDFDVPLITKPEWLDVEKFRRGQKFAREHLFCINFAESLSLFLIFAIKSALQPLIFTGRSHTPFKAFQRYLSTLTRLMSWYEGDFWNEGDEEKSALRNLAVVKMMHRNVQKKLASATENELRLRTTVGDPKSTKVWCTTKDIVQEDFQSSCPMAFPGNDAPYRSPLFVNQFDMAVTQFAFVGLAVTYPKSFGLHRVPDEDLDAFVHMWAGLGHLLGIKDQYNFCHGSLEDVRERTRDFISLTLKPSLREVTPDWEHMCRCLVTGIAYYVPGFTFESALMYLCDLLKIHAPRLRASLTFYQSFMYYVTRFTYNVTCRIPGAIYVFNKLLDGAVRRAQNADSATLVKWEKMEFPYMKQKGKATIAF